MKHVALLLLCSMSVSPISLAHAATYYVRNGGDDNSSGLSHDEAWATLARVNAHSFNPSDSVLLREGDRWQGQIIVDWSGTSQQPVVIGAYRLVNGIPTRSLGGTPSRPIIDGAGSLPDSYDGLIRVRGNRVRIENLELINSGGRGAQFESAAYPQVLNCVVSNTYRSALHFADSDNAYVYGNRISRASLVGTQSGSTWGGAIELVRSDRGWIIRNVVAEVYGEGINAHYGSTGTLIEHNTVYAARAVGIYLDAAPEATVRRNLIIGTTDTAFWRGGQTSGAGIALNNEEYRTTSPDAFPVEIQTRNARIYANLVAFTGYGVAFWGQLAESSFDDVLVFNNTFVDNDVQFSPGLKPKPGAKFLNNIALSVTSGTRDVDTANLNGMIARNNYFSQGNPGGDLSHGGNRYAGLVLGRTTGWRTLNGLDDVSWEDFAIEPGSSVIGAGDDEPLNMSLSDNTIGLDFTGQPHNAPIDMGAIRFGATAARTPRNPTEMHGTPL